MVVTGLLRSSILSQSLDAPFLSCLEIGATTARMEDWFVEGQMIPITLVSNGAQTLAPGTSHTLSDRGDMDMCPGPLPQECISSEGSTLRVRQSGCRWTDQLRRDLV